MISQKYLKDNYITLTLFDIGETLKNKSSNYESILRLFRPKKIYNK